MSEQVDRPSLQSLGKDGVVGVGARAHADVPSLLVSEVERKKEKKTCKNNISLCEFPTLGD